MNENPEYLLGEKRLIVTAKLLRVGATFSQTQDVETQHHKMQGALDTYRVTYRVINSGHNADGEPYAVVEVVEVKHEHSFELRWR